MEIMESFKELVLSMGFPIHMESDFCKRHKDKYSNCFGCESEDGCNRYVALALVNAQSIIYEPKSYEDFSAMQKDVREKMKKILDKNTTKEEVKNLI